MLLTDGDADHFESRPDLERLTLLYRRAGAPPLRFMKRRTDTDRCMALVGSAGDWRCTIYADRPFLCRDLAAGSEHCLEARRRVNLPIE